MSEAREPTIVYRRSVAPGVALTVMEYGSAGPPLILLHGIGSRGVSWWPVIDPFVAHFRLIVPDLRGHGASDKPTSGYLLEDYAADLDGLIAALGHDRPLLVGHSLGGLIAMTWAIHHPDGAACIVLEDVPMRSSAALAPLFDRWRALAALPVDEVVAHFRREYPDWTDEECRRRAESITSAAPAVFSEMRDRALAIGIEDRIPAFTAVRSPVLLVHGDLEAGGVVSAADAARFARMMPQARAERIRGGSHFLHRDHTAAFLAVTLPFLMDESGYYG